MEIEIKTFLNILKNNNEPTPFTHMFDVVNKKGQKDRRWWDKIENDTLEGFSKQKYHIYGTFKCAAYNNWKNGSNNCKWTDCKNCYENDNCNPHNNKLTGNERNIRAKFNSMRKPEMFLWFVEAFKLLNDNQLNCFIEEIEKVTSISALRNLREKYKLWELLKQRMIDIQNGLSEI